MTGEELFPRRPLIPRPRASGEGGEIADPSRAPRVDADVDVEALVSANLALLGHLSRELGARLPRHLDTEDLIGAGALALVQAAQSFDPELGVPFARFASLRIRGAMLDQMRSRDWATRSVRSRARLLATASQELTAALRRAPTEDELAAATGLSRAEVRAVSAGTERATLLSLDPASDGGSLGETVADPDPSPEEILVIAERLGYLRDAVAELPERTRTVVEGYYLQNRQLTAIAAELGVTQSRASQLRAEGLELLHGALTTLCPDDDQPVSRCRGTYRGPQDRRRDDYIRAVATRSTVAARADLAALMGRSAARAPHPSARLVGGAAHQAVSSPTRTHHR